MAGFVWSPCLATSKVPLPVSIRSSWNTTTIYQHKMRQNILNKKLTNDCHHKGNLRCDFEIFNSHSHNIIQKLTIFLWDNLKSHPPLIQTKFRVYIFRKSTLGLVKTKVMKESHLEFCAKRRLVKGAIV